MSRLIDREEFDELLKKIENTENKLSESVAKVFLSSLIIFF